MKKRLNFDILVWSAILFLLLYTFLRMIYNGDIKNFIHPDMVKYAFFAVIALAIMLIYNLMHLFTNEESDGLKYGYILFLIPVAIYMFLKPTGLSESTAVNRGVNMSFYKALSTEEEHQNHSHSHGDGKMLIEDNRIILTNENFFTSVKEIYGHLEEYKEKSVVIKGFAVKEKGRENSFILSRMIVSCCAADTEIIGIRCEYKGSKSIKGGQWVEIQGRFKKYDEKEAPVLFVEKLMVIERPEDSYIYRD